MPVMPARHVAASGLLLLLTACAELPTEMRYYPQQVDASVMRLWPGLPEVPRYQYAGQLTG
ncbi:MAG: hypothetical protein OEY45_13185, partial [Gammaproteobacteria bacterium]|nr:hypothetical protein [Gammaproteobacteria bacterium]